MSSLPAFRSILTSPATKSHRRTTEGNLSTATATVVSEVLERTGVRRESCQRDLELSCEVLVVVLKRPGMQQPITSMIGLKYTKREWTGVEVDVEYF